MPCKGIKRNLNPSSDYTGNLTWIFREADSPVIKSPTLAQRIYCG
jgi:hypothetical protein